MKYKYFINSKRNKVTAKPNLKNLINKLMYILYFPILYNFENNCNQNIVIAVIINNDCYKII